MSRDSGGSVSVATATSAPGATASERGRIATPIPRATSRRIRSLSFDSSLICGSKPACASGGHEQLAQPRALAVADELLVGSSAIRSRRRPREAVPGGQQRHQLLGDELVQAEPVALDRAR